MVCWAGCGTVHGMKAALSCSRILPHPSYSLTAATAVVHLLLLCRDVGSMDTRHHTVSVRIKSVLDSCDDQAGDDAEMQELEGSQQVGGGEGKSLGLCYLGCYDCYDQAGDGAEMQELEGSQQVGSLLIRRESLLRWVLRRVLCCVVCCACRTQLPALRGVLIYTFDNAYCCLLTCVLVHVRQACGTGACCFSGCVQAAIGLPRAWLHPQSSYPSMYCLTLLLLFLCYCICMPTLHYIPTTHAARCLAC
jgi:hypothetical protein